jgi:hypothetical protein
MDISLLLTAHCCPSLKHVPLEQLTPGEAPSVTAKNIVDTC